MEGLIQDLESKLEATLNEFQKDVDSVRTGKPHPAILESVSVNSYGGKSKLNQLASVTVSSSKTLSVKVWDSQNISEVNKAILSSGLGLHPTIEGNMLRVILPDLTEQRRMDLKKAASNYEENCKVALRNIRRTFISKIKTHERSGEISEDDMHQSIKNIDSIVDNIESKVHSILISKHKEIQEF